MVTSGELYTNVMDKLQFEPDLDESNITVAIKDNGIVVLDGKVKSYAEKYTAEKAVEAVKQVKGVANEIVVELIPSHKRSDADIAQAALDALWWSVLVPHEQIKVAVENGHITLTGEIEYNYQKERAKSAVQNLYGITYITNNITVKPGANISSSEVKRKIIREFERNARIDANSIQVEVDGNKVILNGKVRNFDEDREARTAAWSIPGVTNVIDYLTIGW
jgi:osmotically-inducible protein OsmY